LFGNKNETSINYRPEIRFQQTNNVGMIFGSTKHNTYTITRNFSSLNFPHLLLFVSTNVVISDEGNVACANLKTPSICRTPMKKRLNSNTYFILRKSLLEEI
jgi:hypothetical protein